MPEIIVGSVGVQLVPSAKGFQERARALTRDLEATVELKADTEKAKGEIDDASRNRDTKVDVKAETKGAKAELEALQKSMRTKSLDVQARTAGAKVKIGELQREIGDTKARIAVNADDAGAKAKLKELQASLKSLRTRVDADAAPARLEIDRLRASVAAKKVTINADADTAAANAKLDYAARDRTSNISADAAGGGAGLLGTAAALGPALIPVAASLTGIAGALSAPLAAAGGGGTLYGLLTGLSIKSLEKTNKAMAKLQEAIDADKLAVDSATTASGKKSAMAKLATDTKDYHDMLKSLSPAQKQFLATQGAIVAKFATFSSQHAATMLGPLTDGMRLANKLLPQTGPLVDAVGRALDGLVGDLSKWANHGGFKSLIDWMANMSGPAITGLGHTLGNIATGIGGLIKAFSPLSGSVLGGLEDMTKSFSNWANGLGKSSSFHSFLDYIREQGPKVMRLLGTLGSTFVDLIRDLAPLGSLQLSALNGILKFLGAVLKSPVGKPLVELAAGMFAVSRAAKALSLIKQTGMLAPTAAGGTALSKKGKALGYAAGGYLAGGAIASIGSDKSTGGKVANVAGSAVQFGGIGAAVGSVIPGVGTLTGAGIGTAVGALKGLVSEIRKSGHVAKIATPSIDSYVTTLNGMTGAATAATRALVFKGLEKNHAYEAATKLGIAQRTLTNASMGQAGAQKTVNERLAATRSEIARLTIEQRKNFDNKTKYTELQHRIDALRGAYNKVKGATGAFTAKLKAANAERLKELLNTGNLAKAFKGVPKSVITDFKLHEFPKTIGNLESLQKKYKLTPKQVDTIMRVLGFKQSSLSARQLQKLYDLTPKQIESLMKAKDAGASGLVKKLRKQYGGLSKQDVNTLVKAEDKASNVISNVRERLAALNNKTATTFVQTENGKALSAIGVVRDALKTLQNKTIHITTIREARDVSYQAKRFQNEAVNKHATGGPIFGPGTGTSDSIPARLSNGEYVINARATAHNRALLEKINASVPAFAAGGPVATGGPASGNGGVTVQIGEVRAQDYADFMRQAKVRADRAAMDGVRRR